MLDNSRSQPTGYSPKVNFTRCGTKDRRRRYHIPIRIQKVALMVLTLIFYLEWVAIRRICKRVTVEVWHCTNTDGITNGWYSCLINYVCILVYVKKSSCQKKLKYRKAKIQTATNPKVVCGLQSAIDQPDQTSQRPTRKLKKKKTRHVLTSDWSCDWS